MSGVLGGLLGLINIVGGAVLFILVGNKAWGKSDTARWLRLIFGGVSSGYGIGTTLFLNVSVDQYSTDWRPGVCFALIPFLSVMCILGLEGLRRVLK